MDTEDSMQETEDTKQVEQAKPEPQVRPDITRTQHVHPRLTNDRKQQHPKS